MYIKQETINAFGCQSDNVKALVQEMGYKVVGVEVESVRVRPGMEATYDGRSVTILPRGAWAALNNKAYGVGGVDFIQHHDGVVDGLSVVPSSRLKCGGKLISGYED